MFIDYKLFTVPLLVLLLVGSAMAAPAQQRDTLQLRLIRNFGYGGLGKIQGTFTLKVVDPPENLVAVDFYLDGEKLGNVDDPPFEIQFQTGDFQPGEHQLSARGRLVDGGHLDAVIITQTFLSGEQAWAETRGILIPLLIGVGLLSLLGMGLPLLLGREKQFQVGSYGPAGGTVCPRCDLPFSRPVLAPNLVFGKLVRCPHCGKIAILSRAPSDQLQIAEDRYHQREKPEPARGGGEDDLRKLLEESRYED